MNQISKRLTRKVVQVFNGLNNSNPFLGTVKVPINLEYKDKRFDTGKCKGKFVPKMRKIFNKK